MNYCKECGYKLAGEEKFCPSCGESLQAEAAETIVEIADIAPHDLLVPYRSKQTSGYVKRFIDIFDDRFNSMGELAYSLTDASAEYLNTKVMVYDSVEEALAKLPPELKQIIEHDLIVSQVIGYCIWLAYILEETGELMPLIRELEFISLAKGVQESARRSGIAGLPFGPSMMIGVDVKEAIMSSLEGQIDGFSRIKKSLREEIGHAFSAYMANGYLLGDLENKVCRLDDGFDLIPDDEN